MVLDFIKKFLAEHSYSPSYREIMTGLGFRSISTVAEHIENLVAKGYLEKKDGSARSLEPVEQLANTASAKQSPVEELFNAKLAELQDDPEAAGTLKKAAELLGVKLS